MPQQPCRGGVHLCVYRSPIYLFTRVSALFTRTEDSTPARYHAYGIANFYVADFLQEHSSTKRRYPWRWSAIPTGHCAWRQRQKSSETKDPIKTSWCCSVVKLAAKKGCPGVRILPGRGTSRVCGASFAGLCLQKKRTRFLQPGWHQSARSATPIMCFSGTTCW